MDRADYTKANAKAWNASAPFHNQGAEWDALVADFAKPDFSVLDSYITDALSRYDMSGKSVVQIGCHNGRELLSIDSLGAVDCLGIDISAANIEAARALNADANRGCEFLCTDIYNLPSDVREDFDLAFISIGVVGWMPEIADFFDAIARLLKPGGSVVIYETHPFLEMFDPHCDQPLLPAFSYFHKEPFVETEPIVYDGQQHEGDNPAYWFVHTLGEVVTACVNSGFRISNLEEFAHSNREVAYAVYENQPAQVPMCFILEAQLAPA